MIMYNNIDKDNFLFTKIMQKYPLWRRNEKSIDYINCYGTTGLLRFVERDGKKILQQEYKIKLVYFEPVSHGSYDPYWKEEGTIWGDISLELENEL